MTKPLDQIVAEAERLDRFIKDEAVRDLLERVRASAIEDFRTAKTIEDLRDAKANLTAVDRFEGALRAAVGAGAIIKNQHAIAQRTQKARPL